VDALNPSGGKGLLEGKANFKLAVRTPVQIPAYGDLAEAPTPEVLGPDDGLTLDQAISALVERNLALLALRYELPMAEADILTASLRSNPIFYADAQLVPYGHYSNHRPGGQRQFDVNVTYPLDVTLKRLARTAVADRARAVTAAQFQDVVRQQIDNLYTVYVDVLAAQQTLAYSRAFAEGIARVYERTTELYRAGAAIEADVDKVKAQVEQSQLQIREASEAVVTASRNLALLLDVPRNQADSLQVRAFLRDVRPIPTETEELVQLSMSSRADMLAQRLGVARADADVRLAEANRYPDVYLLYQPYTLQDNTPFGFKSAYSWAVGVTATLPVYNRNQGNVQRARLNAQQTRVETAGLERQVAHEVEQAVREFNLSRTSVVELEKEVLPAVRRVRDTAFQRWRGQETTAIEYLEAQKDYNESVKNYRDALVRHRRAMLDLNTAVGVRLMP
jgi:cobalt-zinc-cadmium efflux system outer membrane protein